MGETKEKHLLRGLKLARIITAALAGLIFLVAFSQIIFFQNIKVSFQTGTDAQQLATMKMKKGSKVDLPTPLKPGSYFLGWSLSPESAEVIEDSSGLMKDTTLYAVWDGAEKYAVLSVNGIPYREVNIFDTSVEGLTATELNEGKFGDDSWRVLDDYAQDNPNLAAGKKYYGQNIDPYNNFSRFLGWRYLNSNNTYNDLLYTQDDSGTAGTWTWIQRDEDNNIIKETEINDTNRFYPPNYRTTFKALLDYRTINIQLWDKNKSSNYATFTVKLGEENVTLPIFENNPTAQFSHWEMREGHLKSFINADERPELAEAISKIKKRYEAGETLEVLDPLWYYYANELRSPDGRSELQVYLRFDAIYWDDTTVDHYTIQRFTDLDSGTTYENFGDVKYNNLTVNNPVAYDPDGDCFWLYFNTQILSYAFYDHKGVYHVLTTDQLKETRAITIGGSMTLLGQEIYFKDEWGINVMVNYQSSSADVTVRFVYGDDLYLLPSYRHYENTVSTALMTKIGDSFEILSSEKYMKSNYIFTGWQISGDESGRLYCTGEKFTVPNFDTENETTVIEFVAVWNLQRLLFNFDFDGGSWATEEGPDFTLMKGAYGDRVRIVSEPPVKFGYDFTGWTLEDGTDLLQPNDFILVGTKFQTLHAHWTAKRLRVIFYVRYDAVGSWAPSDTLTTDVNTKETLYSGGVVELNEIPTNKYYTPNGWQIGDRILTDTRCQLTTQILSQLETVVREDDLGSILEVHIYASQTKRTLNVEYDLTVDLANTTVDISHNVVTADLVTVLPQGDLFYDYYPFSVIRTNGSYAAFDSQGRKFVGWSYITNNSNQWVSIEADTPVPTGVNKITVRGELSNSKSITIQYHNHNQEVLRTDNGLGNGYNFGNSLQLLNYDDLGMQNEISEWGTFVGWAFEPDYKAGNPEIIYDVYNYRIENSNINPQLQLSNQNDTASAPYLINMDRYAVPAAGEMNYTLHLYAVYATDYAMITYANLQTATTDDTQLKFPTYSNADYSRTIVGGRTVGYDSDDFAEYGISVLDDNGLIMWSSTNFIGWQAVLPNGVSDAVREEFVNKIWFPGEFLPSVDFSFQFVPIRITQNGSKVEERTYGNRTYRILSLSLDDLSEGFEYTGSVDVVALPRGNYTISQGGIVINSDREVHVIIPSDSSECNIVLEPRAIQCNTIKEFYVGDNLTITGSPVVGANFQNYRIRKGYRLMNEASVPTAIQKASTKYNFVASLSGLLASSDNTTLYGVPSHTALTTEKLLAFVQESVEHIAPYALSEINTLTDINLNKNTKLKIDAAAIYGGSVRNVILPASTEYDESLVIDPQVLAGALTNLASVTFGDATTTSTWYAFVDNNVVYYIDDLAVPNAKTHIMYVLRTVKLNNLTYINNNLPIDDAVSKIEPMALMGLDWSQINSVMANNVDVDLTVLIGVPTNIPLFTSAENIHKGPMVQPLNKTFRFTYREGQTAYETISVSFEYGQTFRVFSAQKNNYDVLFNRSWSQFVAWKFNGKLLRVGEVYKVGIDETILGDKYTLQFDASGSDSWRSFPVRFSTYNETFTPDDFTFNDIDNNTYTMADLFDSNNLSNIYLPGLDQTVTIGSSEYKFIGWATKTMKTNSSTPNLWNNVDLQFRILPNHTANTSLTSGSINSEGIYIYYALYEKATPNIEYTLLDDGTYAVTGFTKANVTSLNIPFAVYNDGYMVPVSKINNVFNGVTNNANTTLTEIAIGGAVSEIAANTFNNVRSSEIKFAHKGRSIYYNYRQSTAARQLVIGDYAFANNTTVTNLVLPAAAESLGSGAFQSCISLYRVTLESGYSPYLRNLGDFVFSEDYTLKDNAIITLLTQDGKNGDNRFVSVGNGIFRNTNVESVDGTNKIVWRDTLLHTYYPSGYDKNLVFNEKFIAGYAFVNLGSETDSSVDITIKFSNPNVQIKANAFSNLNQSISTINLKGSSIKIANVDVNAFDDTLQRSVDVYVDSVSQWTQKYEELLKKQQGKTNVFRFRTY